MVVSPYTTLFVAPQYAKPSRSETPEGVMPYARRDQHPNAAERKPEYHIVRPVLEAVASDKAQAQNLGFNASHMSHTRQNHTEISQDQNDHFDKVQTFLQIQSFEEQPNLIDTFV